MRRAFFAVVLLFLSFNALADDRIVQNFDAGWLQFDSAVDKPWLQGYVKNGWLGDRPPYLMPNISFQMGPARIYRREGTPGKEVISGKYALGMVTGNSAVNVLSNCGATFTPRRARSQVSAWMKGKGKVRFRIYAYNSEKRAIDIPFIGTFEVTPEWKLYKALYEPNKLDIKEWGVVLEIAANSEVDIDDIAISGISGKEIVMPANAPKAVTDFEKVAVAFPAGAAINIDGRLDEAAWEKAEWNSGFLRHKDQANLTPAQAQFAFLFDDTNIYFGFISAESGMDAGKLKPTPPGKWPDGQPVEIFLDPGATRDTYYQFAANIIGGTYEGIRMDATWDCNWKAAGFSDGNQWVLEAAIPFAAFGRTKPVSGELWAINVCRNGPFMGPWAPVGPAYHNPAGFGLLTFGTYEEWWNAGFLPSAEKQVGQLRGIPGIDADASLSRQVKIAEELLNALQARAGTAGTKTMDRTGFMELFHGADQVRVRLENAIKEWRWVESINRPDKT